MTKDWETEFDVVFPYLKHAKTCAGRRHYNGKNPFDCSCGAIDENAATVDELKSFIRTLLAAAKQEGREEAVEYIDRHISRSKTETEGMYLGAWERVLAAARQGSEGGV